MSTLKVFKKGEVLFKEGESAKIVYLIQSGSVSLSLARQKQTIELCLLGSNQVAGEHALSGATTHPHTATATSETKVIELPVDAVKTQLETASQLTKVLAKGLSDKLRVVLKELQSMKLEKDNSPCPAEQTPKIFASLFHAARLKGEAHVDGLVKSNWPGTKSYAQKIFLESPKRLEQAANIFVKLGAAKYEWVKNDDDPEAPEEIGFIHFNDLGLIEQFFEFFQYYYYKPGKGDMLKTDDRVMQLTSVLIELGKAETPDRGGIVRLDYSKVVERVKEVMGLALNADHFTVMESKGLFVKRQSNDKGIMLQFEFKEFDRTYKIWRVLREVERWNEKGSVDPNEPVEISKVKKVAGGCECPSCHHQNMEAAKFCSECGTKIQQAA